MRSSKLFLVGLALLLVGTNAGQLTFTQVSIGDVSQNFSPGSTASFIEVKPTAGPNQDAFDVTLQFKNLDAAIVVQNVTVKVYAGSYTDSIPAKAQELQIDTSGLTGEQPKIASGGGWPGNGFDFLLGGDQIPETTACTPYDATIQVTTTYTTSNSPIPTSEVDLIPVGIVRTCLSMIATPTGQQLPVTVTFESHYAETNEAHLPFLIDFSDKVLELNPLKLFNVTGSNRTDVVYAVETGKIYLMVYPDYETSSTLITVTVPAGVTTNAAGIPNGAASAVAQYKPKIGSIHAAALALTGVFAGVVAASWITSFIVSSVQPWATAGSLGYGAIGFILWAQKLYLSGLMDTPMMPANYRTLSNTFAWADMQAGLPWEWGSSSGPSGVTKNLTVPSAIFESNAVVLMNSRTANFAYYYPSGGAMASSVPPPAPAPSPPNTTTAQPPSTLLPDIPITPVPVPVPVVPPSPNDPNAGVIPVVSPPSVATDTPSSADSCSVLQNSDFYGGDLPNSNFGTTDPQECCNACLANPGCYVWTLSFVQNQCYLKGQDGWQQRDNRTCCLSGTANRGGVPPILPLNNSTDSPNADNALNSADNALGGGGNGNNNNNSKGNRRLLSTSMLSAKPCDVSPNLRSSTGRHLSQVPLINNSSVVGPENIRYIVTSTASGFSPGASSLIVIQNADAGGKVKYIVDAASQSTDGSSTDPYLALEQVGFWLACILGLACLFNLCAWMFVRCCEGEIPGVLYVPRLQLIILMLSLSGLTYAGALLFSGGYGLVPMCVGIAVVVIVPVLFLLAAYIGIQAALYRKRKAVYLLSSRSTTSQDENPEHSKWDMRVVAGWMGMSLNRGKWRPSDPSRKNEFVFRWGPLFEDCRGPMYQRRKNSSSNGNMTLRHRHTPSDHSDHSSQSGQPYRDNIGEISLGRSSTSRRKVGPLEEKPLGKICGHTMRRSSFQAFGVVISFARMVAYALAIGGLGTWPAAQTGTCLGIAVAYLIYLRFTVPYSRRDEMALEYWIALLDIILFTLLLVLSTAVGDTDFNSMDDLGIGLIVIQCLGFASYLINRCLIIVHAFSEVVCPACSCGAPSPRKSRRSRSSRSRSGLSRSESMNYSMSDVGTQQSYSTDAKSYYLGENGIIQLDANAKEIDSASCSDPGGAPAGATAAGAAYLAPQQVQDMAHAQQLAVDGRSTSRSKRLGGPGMFPSIAEETDSQVGSPVGMTNTSSQHSKTFQPDSPLGRTVPVEANAKAERTSQLRAISSLKGSPQNDSTPVAAVPAGAVANDNGQNAVFDKFWKSL